MYTQEVFNVFKDEVGKLIGRSGLIHLQNDVDYKLIVRRYTGFSVADHYDDETDPMIFRINFLNGEGSEDAIEIWDSAISAITFEHPDAAEAADSFGLRFAFSAVKDDSNAIDFYGD
ncbi:hypothetical protein [Paenibacillus arenilitoris]|uniref:Uncharacterized protein n=1 Tax=Paenibacillus arenilitoris TaxID=2772299 RepID=A0A927CNX9_9BACL|nr:hypothetical protein [Paenibacillus arenilitoris]MBD2870083.1 hypothetical protein [Paenibacillus arenilitoris]